MRSSGEDAGAKTLAWLVVAVALALGLLLVAMAWKVDQLGRQVQSIQRQQKGTAQ